MSIRLRIKRRTPSPPPVVTVNPTISSDAPGGEVGVAINSGPPVFTPTTAHLEAQFVIGTTPIDGVAAGSSLLPSVALLGQTVRCRWTISVFGAQVVVYSPTIGPIAAGDAPPAEGSEFDGVHAETMTARAAFVSEFDVAWNAEAAGFWDDLETDQVATSLADLLAKWDGIMTTVRLGAVDRSKRHRIRLDGSQPGANWAGQITLKGAGAANQAVIPGGVWSTGHMFGSWADLASYGGGILIEPLDAEAPPLIYSPAGSAQAIYVLGFRGAYIRGLNVANITAVPTRDARGVACGIRISRGSTNQRDASVAIIEGCRVDPTLHPAYPGDIRYCPTAISTSSALEQVYILRNELWNFHRATGSSGVRFQKIHGNDYKGALEDCELHVHTSSLTAINSAWDERSIIWARLNTARAWANEEYLSTIHSDKRQVGTQADLGGYSLLEEFDCAYAERNAGTDYLHVTPGSNYTEGQTVTVDGNVYTFRAAPAGANDVLIGATTGASLTNFKAALDADDLAGVVFVEILGSSIDIHKPFGQVATGSTSKAGSTITKERTGGGTQGHFRRSYGTHRTDNIEICNIIAGTAAFMARSENSTTIVDRCTYARIGGPTPNPTLEVDGFTDYQDFEPHVSSNRKTGHTVTATIRNSVVGVIDDGVTNYTADGVATPNASHTLTRENNRYVDWKVGAVARSPDSMLAGTFGTNAGGQVTYAFTDDGAETPAQFRARLYAQLMLADTGDRAAIGPTNPSTWPAI